MLRITPPRYFCYFNHFSMQSLQVSVEVEEERISNRLGKTVDLIKSEKEALLSQLEKEKAAAAAIAREHDAQRLELKKLQGSNFVMQQRIAKEASKLEGMQREKSYIAQRLEAEWEKHFNVMIRDKNKDSQFGPFGARANSLDEWGLPELDCEFAADPDDVGDVVGELSLMPTIFQKRRSHKWESQSLPSFSPRNSPYPSPPGTPYSSRSRSPARSIGAGSMSSRDQSPSARSARSTLSTTSSILSASETTGVGGVAGVVVGCAGVSRRPSVGLGQAPVSLHISRGVGVLPPPPSLTRSPSADRKR
mmetsp:Transcript_86068/g.139593  ORF Transcript_86068/g.139593 Transcript_86068/m.139593 type:complete len:306 (+) Transcript_86068:1088-2005(+)